MNRSRYIIGIDLGTTTCSLSYIDTLSKDKVVNILSISQWERKNELINKNVLPSFCYILKKNEIKKEEFVLPTTKKIKDSNNLKTNKVLGRLAQDLQASDTDRVIHSAKSWLCHKGIDPNAKCLPWNSDSLLGDERFSPVEVSSFYLKHLKDEWNVQIGNHQEEYSFEKQNIVLTVPASFDEVASQLTLAAAELAGYNMKLVKLLEEPQAAFYSWLNFFEETDGTFKNLEKKISQKVIKHFPDIINNEKTILVCDIGGGTSDFSLFKFINKNSSRETLDLEIKRIKVSDHILLGGDNIDLHIASLLESKYQEKKNKKLSSQQWSQILSNARELKIKILKSLDQKSKHENYTYSISESGSKLFSSSTSIAISQEEITEKIFEGFFPSCQRNTTAKISKDAFKEWDLPYAVDTAFTHHLSEFMAQIEIDGVLFAGGTLIPDIFQKKIIKNLESWQERKITNLYNPHLNLSVSYGASIYGLNLIEKQINFISHYPRSVYIEIEKNEQTSKKQQPSLLCLVNKGYDTTQTIEINNIDLQLLINKPSVFRVYFSNNRPNDHVGDIIFFDKETIKHLSNMQTKVFLKEKKLKKISILLRVNISSHGLLEISCIPKDKETYKNEKWTFEFNLQNKNIERKDRLQENQINTNNSIQENELINICNIFSLYYGKKKNNHLKDNKRPSLILNQCEEILKTKKQDWTLDILRKLWEEFIPHLTRRSRSESHESTWLNIAGFLLRPGYGDQLDNTRVEELSKIFSLGISHTNSSQVQAQWWILWRRISGGLNKDIQEKIFAKLFPVVKKDEASTEMLMTIGSLERVDSKKKINLAHHLIEQLCTIGNQHPTQKLWSLTRIASRKMLFSGYENVLRPNCIREFYNKLKNLDMQKKEKYRSEYIRFLINSGMLLNNRELDLANNLRQQYIIEAQNLKSTTNEIKPLTEVVTIDFSDKSKLFGESLPPGLSLQ